MIASMKEIFVLLNFGGYIALLIWGVHMVQTGVQRAFGAQLGAWLGRALDKPSKAFITGAAITSAVQSSTATGLMITSFAAGGLLALVPALVAMLGANVGTTLIVQLLSFHFTAFAPALILLGVWMFQSQQAGRKRDLGRVAIGLGLLLLALNELVSLFEPLDHAPLFTIVLDALADAPLLGLVLAAVLTWAAHSSVAIVVLIMSLASQAIIAPELTYALVLGANLGTAVNPILEGVRGNDPAAKRLPVGNFGTRLAGCVAGIALLPWIPSLMTWITPDPARAVANFHTLFNVLVACAFFPLLKPYARLLNKYFPKRADPEDPAKPAYLDESAHEVPPVALGNAAREALRLADMLQNILSMARTSLLSTHNQSMSHMRYILNAANRLDMSITTYLAKLDQENLNKDDTRRLNEILNFASNITHAASVSVTSLSAHMNNLRKLASPLSELQQQELQKVLDRLTRNQRQAAALFVAEDVKTARYLAFEKDYFRELEQSVAQRHLDNIKAGHIQSADINSLYLEIIRDLGAINSYLVSAVAYPILARHGELLANRVRNPEDINP